jgi:hypothetical protein
MDIDQAKWFLQVFADGKKLNTLTIRELYLSGYIGIELLSPGKEPLPTVITEKGKQVLETRWGRMRKFSCFALSAGHGASHASGCPAAENVAPVRVARLMNGC